MSKKKKKKNVSIMNKKNEQTFNLLISSFLHCRLE
jgi:hypothetical protein